MILIKDPKYNQPKQARCEKCNRIFIKQPWSGVYSTGKGELVILCPKCAEEELANGSVTHILY